jgi:hypothetical protein
MVCDLQMTKIERRDFFWPFWCSFSALAGVAPSLQGWLASDVLVKEFGNWVTRNSFDTSESNVILGNFKMSEKKTIRIVKKGEQKRPAVVKKASSAREAAREMVQNVTNWVTEFEQKRRAETSNALRILSKTPRSSEA